SVDYPDTQHAVFPIFSSRVFAAQEPRRDTACASNRGRNSPTRTAVEPDFAVAKRITAIGLPDDGKARRYALTGLLVCEGCGRRLDGHWVHGNPGYGCRHGSTSAHPGGEGPKWVYWSQARLFRKLRDAHREVALLGDAEDLAAYLRAGDLVVVCGPGVLMIDAAATVEDETEPVDDEPENEHLQQWPLSLEPRSRAGGSSQKTMRLPRQGTKDNTPARHHVKRE
ncbi:MAG TPA: hypothetical protein VFG35_21570, partial [Actinoplanes sp.]|nr:hypothetical protein [Actinoplanes sp.]